MCFFLTNRPSVTINQEKAKGAFYGRIQQVPVLHLQLHL